MERTKKATPKRRLSCCGTFCRLCARKRQPVRFVVGQNLQPAGQMERAQARQIQRQGTVRVAEMAVQMVPVAKTAASVRTEPVAQTELAEQTGSVEQMGLVAQTGLAARTVALAAQTAMSERTALSDHQIAKPAGCPGNCPLNGAFSTTGGTRTY